MASSKSELIEEEPLYFPARLEPLFLQATDGLLQKFMMSRIATDIQELKVYTCQRFEDVA